MLGKSLKENLSGFAFVGNMELVPTIGSSATRLQSTVTKTFGQPPVLLKTALKFLLQLITLHSSLCRKGRRWELVGVQSAQTASEGNFLPQDGKSWYQA